MEKLKKWIPAFIVMGVIFGISSLPGKTVHDLGLGRESLHINAHFFLFFILCLSFFKPTKNILLAIFLSIIYAVFDELHQMFTPMRSVSLFDIYVDTAGILLAGLFLWKLQHILPKRLENWLNK